MVVDVILMHFDACRTIYVDVLIQNQVKFKAAKLLAIICQERIPTYINGFTFLNGLVVIVAREFW